MTKYILAGGYIQKAVDGGKAFCEEMVSKLNIDKKIRILYVAFAEPKHLWEEKMLVNKELFSKFINNFELQLAQVENFTEQIKDADVVYVRGGDTDLLFEVLSSIDGWYKELVGKVYVGASAGAEVISKYVYNLDTLCITEYLGIFPIKFIPHWKSDYNAPNIDWDKAYDDLKEYKEDLPIHTLKEGEFKVFNQ
jgi:peptidase E